MPEPVVIIGPTNRPAKNASVAARPAKRGLGRRILRWTAIVLARALWAAWLACRRAIGSNPRMSLAAGISILILGAIWVTQPRPGIGKRSIPTNKIAGNLFAPAAKDQHHTAGTKPKAAAADRSETARADRGTSEAARPDATVQPNLPVVAKSADDPPPIHSLTGASTTGQKQPESPEKSAAAYELASGSKAEQELAPESAHDSRSPTLVAAPVPDPARAPPASIAQEDKRGADSPQTDPVLDPPASPPALTTTSPPIEPPSVPASANDPLQLASALESVANDTKPAQDPAHRPVTKSPERDASTAEHKLSGEAAVGQTKPILNPEPSPVLDLAAPVHASTGEPKTLEGGPKRPATSPSDVPELIPSTPPEGQAALPASEPPGKPTALAPSQGLPISRLDSAAPAALPLKGSTAPPTGSTPPSQDAAAGSESLAEPGAPRTDSAPPTSESKAPPTGINEPEPQITKTKPPGPRAEPDPAGEPASAGWVSIPNTGKVPVDGGEEIAAKSGDADLGIGAGSANARDLRAHTAKDVSFELESSQPRTPAARGPRPSPNW